MISWETGPLRLTLSKPSAELRVHYRYDADPLDVADRVHGDAMVFDDHPSSELLRVAFHQPPDEVTVMPATANRPVIIRPESTLQIAPQQRVTLYVSTPLWYRMSLGEDGPPLLDIPTSRPSDTWFGPSPRDGELCYAARTAARLRLEDLPKRRARAITPVIVHNNDRAPLGIERIQLPVQYLSLFQGDNHFIWTEAVEMNHAQGQAGADINVRPGAPKEAGKAFLLRKPRLETGGGLFVRTFGAFQSWL